MRTIILLILSNLFMTMAWYGHLRYRSAPLIVVILTSWLIALPEYVLQVPANRFGYGQFTAAELKIFQEIISITVFVVFSFFYLREAPTWRTGLAFLLIIGAVLLVVGPTARAGRLLSDRHVQAATEIGSGENQAASAAASR